MEGIYAKVIHVNPGWEFEGDVTNIIFQNKKEMELRMGAQYPKNKIVYERIRFFDRYLPEDKLGLKVYTVYIMPVDLEPFPSCLGCGRKNTLVKDLKSNDEISLYLQTCFKCGTVQITEIKNGIVLSVERTVAGGATIYE